MSTSDVFFYIVGTVFFGGLTFWNLFLCYHFATKSRSEIEGKKKGQKNLMEENDA